VEPTTPVERLIYAHVGREWSEAAEGNAATRPSQPVGFDQWRDEHGDGPVVATTRMPKGLDAADYFGLLIGAPEELTLRTSALPTRPAPAGNGGPAPTSEEPAPPIVRGGDMDLLAWYRPFHQVPLPHWLAGEPEWGIYLTTGGIERLAHEAFVSGGMSPEQALVTAATALYHHELFHGLVEVAATLLEQDPRLTASYPAHAATHATAQEGNCLIAEGMANAFSLRHTDDQSGLASWMRNGPPGYRDFDERMGTRAATRDSVHDLFTHITSTAPADWPILIETTLDLGLEHVGLHEFPLRLIATPGSAYERGDWSWRGAAVLR
jgi:hypothetical protein